MSEQKNYISTAFSRLFFDNIQELFNSDTNKFSVVYEEMNKWCAVKMRNKNLSHYNFFLN